MKTQHTLFGMLLITLAVGGCTSTDRDRIGEIPAQSEAKAYQVEAQQLLRQIYSMQETYFAANRQYGTDLATIGVAIPRNAHYRYQLTARGSSWSCSATANLDQDATVDTWVVDQSGRITCSSDDAVS
jgi:hypothetical protein